MVECKHSSLQRGIASTLYSTFSTYTAYIHTHTYICKYTQQLLTVEVDHHLREVEELRCQFLDITGGGEYVVEGTTQ